MDAKVRELVVSTLKGNLQMLKMHLADFSDADMLVRPVPAANHAAWQIGHLVAGEKHLVNACTPGAGADLPAGFAERFTKHTSKVDDPAKLAGKAQLLELFEKVRAATIKWAQSLTSDDLGRPGPESLRAFFPTVGDILMLHPAHLAMHVGQIQVIRRKLGKPVLF